MKTKTKIMEFFSAFGRSLMLPIATLAATGILLGMTAALMKPEIQELFPFLTNEIVFYIISTIKNITVKVFGLIPVLFSISIALGLAKKEKEIAAMAGFIGYYIMLWSSSLVINSGLADFGSVGLTSILGIENTLQMGAVAGMLSGILVAIIHNRFYNVEFPVAIAFFGGKRFVAIAVIVCLSIVGQVIPFIWMPISAAINALGNWIASLGHFGVFVFGFLERLLIPTGLHHILNGIFRTTSIGGVYEGVEGVLNIFFQFFGKVDIEELKPFTAFLGQGKMPYMMFGLPAAALAIYKTTPENKRGKVKALMIAGAATSFVTGITEPIEFAFMFIAPILFVFHSVMAGLSFALMSLLGVGIGNTGGGIIDFTIYGVMVPGSKWYMVILVGVFYSAIYYSVFKWYLARKNISIDVNEDLDDDVDISTEQPNGEKSFLANRIIEGLGGKDNIVEVNNCISRLRVDIKDMSFIDEKKLKSTGSLGIVKPSNTHIQVIYGPKVQSIASQVKDALANSISRGEIIYAPISGQVIPLKEVKDPTFSEEMLGKGFAIEPLDGRVVAPIDCTVSVIFNTMHAIGLQTDSGLELLIHIGIDTVKLKGKYFTPHVKVGDRVRVGDLLMEFDIDGMRSEGYEVITPVIVSNTSEYSSFQIIKLGTTKENEKVLKVSK